ncbi:unnamed protein product [Effrenium voratum]|nr:unnamed protein product [Effrenium voratum]
MKQGGLLDVQVARWLIQPAGEQATLERVCEAGSKYDLTKVLFWEPRRVFRRRTPTAAADLQADFSLQQAMLKAVRANGSATLEELKASVWTRSGGSNAEKSGRSSQLRSLKGTFWAELALNPVRWPGL